MNIYRIEMSFEVDDSDVAWSVDYVTHKEKFTKFQFQELCAKALKRCEDATIYDLKVALKEDGFANIEPVATFEFAEA